MLKKCCRPARRVSRKDAATVLAELLPPRWGSSLAKVVWRRRPRTASPLARRRRELGGRIRREQPGMCRNRRRRGPV